MQIILSIGIAVQYRLFANDAFGLRAQFFRDRGRAKFEFAFGGIECMRVRNGGSACVRNELR